VLRTRRSKRRSSESTFSPSTQSRTRQSAAVGRFPWRALMGWADAHKGVEKETKRLQVSLEELKRGKKKLLKLLMDEKISQTTYTESEAEYSDGINSAEPDLRNL
jgi:hypothetical protein